MSFFFDGYSAEPRPPKRRVRRDYKEETEQLKEELAALRDELKAAKEATALEAPPPAAEARTWSEAAEHLPKDEQGHVDWVAALEAGAVAPRPGLDAKAANQAVLDMNVELAASGNKLFSVTFSHSAHTGWLTCSNCHPSIFPLRQGAEPTVVTMAKINAGEYCGVCHGKVAFGTDLCARCHAAMGGPVAEAKEKPAPLASPRGPGTELKTWDEATKALPQKLRKSPPLWPRPGGRGRN
jgi:c(7)-type cytochrome triheme protein